VLAIHRPTLVIVWWDVQRYKVRLHHHEKVAWSKITMTCGKHPGTWFPINGASMAMNKTYRVRQDTSPNQDVIPHERPNFSYFSPETIRE
jgi:hypothetical protein